MVYEANARIRDPVYGCAGVICQLQKQISGLQAEFAKAQAEILNLKCQNSNLLALVCMEVTEYQENSSSSNDYGNNTSLFLEDNSVYAAWETLWTWLGNKGQKLLRLCPKHEDNLVTYF